MAKKHEKCQSQNATISGFLVVLFGLMSVWLVVISMCQHF